MVLHKDSLQAGQKYPRQGDYWRLGTNEDDTTLVKERKALNSGLLKQLFDRHYVLAKWRAGRNMWLVPPLISEPTSREMLIKNTLALTNLSFHSGRRLNKKLDPLTSRLKIWDLFGSRGNPNAKCNEKNKPEAKCKVMHQETY